MNGRTRVSLVRWCLASLCGLAVAAHAAPGAHGPGGEHLDAAQAASGGPSLPRLEASTEAFELVGTLHATGLSILIDRYDTNEPVLDAKLEVESGGVKAVARFRADHGDYAVDDAKLLPLLHRPGEHALVFTLVAGKDSDLLDGTLVTSAVAGAHGHDDGTADHDHGVERAAWAGGAGVLVALLAWLGWRIAQRAARTREDRR